MRRETPRSRHEVPSALLLLGLWPLFRYSEWRDSWVLRGIGEWYGPVLVPAKHNGVAPAAPVAAPLPGPLRERRFPIRLHPRSVLLALTLTMVAAVLGFVIARAGAGPGPPSVPALDNHVSAGLIEISYPSGWRQITTAAAPQVGLTDELTLAPPAPAGRLLLVGRSVTADPSVLPPSLLATLPAPPQAQIVSLGNATFYRYLNLSPRGENTSESVYAWPTTVGTILGLCVARTPSSSFTSSCERVLATIRLSSGSSALGPSPAYASALDAVISKLNAVRSAAGLQLRTAGDAAGQAKAAGELATAHTAAATAILGLDAGTASAANSALAAALRRIGSAYGAVALAAARSDAASYRIATASVTRATLALNSAFAQLQSLRYRVG